MAWNIQTLGSFFGLRGSIGTQRKGPQVSSGGATSTESAIVVTQSNSMQVSAFYAATHLIANSIASLPLNCYKLDSNGKRLPNPVKDIPLAERFASRPNRYQTTHNFWLTIASQDAAHLNAYSLITRVGKRITSLMPLMADQMQVIQDEAGDLIYMYNDGGVAKAFAAESIWHLRGMGNLLTGDPLLSSASEAVGLSLAADRCAAKFAKNGFKPKGVLMMDKLLKTEQRDAIRKSFSDLTEGDNDQLRVLEAGMTYSQVSLSPADSQLLESRKYQLEEIARFFGVPAVLIGQGGTSAWGANVIDILDGWYRVGLGPRLERIEASINEHLLSPEERGRYEFEFDTERLLRMNPVARVTRVKELVQQGIMTPNEGRVEMGYAASTDTNADFLYMQAQMVRLGTPPTKPPVAIPSNSN